MIIQATIVLGMIGFLAGMALALASKLFYLPVDPRLEKVKAALPGINCGICGFIGCEDAAKAILAGKAYLNVCVSGGAETTTAVAGALGIDYRGEAGLVVLECKGGQRAERRYHYLGARDCRAQAVLGPGALTCEMGCIGLGTCVRACPFGALAMGSAGVPVLAAEKCHTCGRCVDACPRGVLRLAGLTDQLLGLNQNDQCLAPCQQRCPTQIEIPRFMGKLRDAHYAEALATIKARNPFPLTCGRVCPHPCENICRRNIADESVAVSKLERFLGEWELASGRRQALPCAPETEFKIAVLGGGPAGLACSYFLRRLGHRPTIFEAQSELGGMLRYGIPEYRLPKRIVDWEVNSILSLGIAVGTDMRLGDDFDLEELQHRGYHAIFLGMGAWQVPTLCVRGEYAVGVVPSLDFLAGVGTEFKSLRSKTAAVIGESNTAMDCARSCIRLGARAVEVICPTEREDMSARKRDVERALEEGVAIHFATTPVQIADGPDGRVRAILYRHLQPGAAENGPDRFIPRQPDGSRRIEVDLVIAAYERKPDLTCLWNKGNKKLKFNLTKDGTLAADRDTLMAAAPNIFTAGDFHTGRATVIGAVGGGRRAARSIHLYLTHGRIPVSPLLQRRINPNSILKNVQVASSTPQIVARELPVELRRHSFVEEVEATIDSMQATSEAHRCLHCGTFCYDSVK